MTDAHCHVTGGDPSVRELLIGRDFVGVHPWEAGALSPEDVRRKTEDLAARLTSSVSSPRPFLGVGEIGLDRLKEKEISPQMRELFEAQLKLALEFRRPVVLHGAKCWGQVVKAIQTFLTHSPAHPLTFSPSHRPPPFLFHGFSRSDGLIPDIVALGGFISVGPAVLNDHAVNYRELVKKIPSDRLLLETDRTPENAATCPSVREVAAKVAELRGMSLAELEALTDRNVRSFLSTVTDSLACARSVRDDRSVARSAVDEKGCARSVRDDRLVARSDGDEGACARSVRDEGRVARSSGGAVMSAAFERTERAHASESVRDAELQM